METLMLAAGYAVAVALVLDLPRRCQKKSVPDEGGDDDHDRD